MAPYGLNSENQWHWAKFVPLYLLVHEDFAISHYKKMVELC
jgi:hypothetical protein